MRNGRPLHLVQRAACAPLEEALDRSPPPIHVIGGERVAVDAVVDVLVEEGAPPTRRDDDLPPHHSLDYRRQAGDELTRRARAWAVRMGRWNGQMG